MDITESIAKKLDYFEKKHKSASLVVCGGTSVIEIFNKLSKKDINWQNIIITLVDDRLVEFGHKDSNETLVRNNLLLNNASKATFVPLSLKTITIQKALMPFTTVLLSMGADGHFASIFSEMLTEPNIANPKAMPEAFITGSLGLPRHRRITMNLAMILGSESIFLVVNGKEKVKTFEQAKNNKKIPINRLVTAKHNQLNICHIDTRTSILD